MGTFDILSLVASMSSEKERRASCQSLTFQELQKGKGPNFRREQSQRKASKTEKKILHTNTVQRISNK
eukprot:4187912-Amphidinium_carterae.1